MKQKFTRALVTGLSLSLLAIPFVYNSCQGVMSSGGFASQNYKSASCKVVLDKGQVTKLDFNKPIDAFAGQKVKLRSNSENAQQKANALTVAAGTELSVVVHNACVQSGASNSAIVQAFLRENEVSEELLSQAFTWKLDRDYSEGELSSIADADACVMGLSWNREYALQSYSDAGYSYQTHLSSISAEAGWTQFFNNTYGMKFNVGPKVTVAAIDTGVDWTHPDLQQNIWVNTNGWGVDATTLKQTTTPINYNPFDISPVGHGTHVAGIIAAASNNNVGIVGTMPYRANVMAVKVFKMDGGVAKTNSTYIYNGIEFAYLNGASVINLSLAATLAGANTDVVAEAGIQQAVNRGVVVITVMGNAAAGASGQLIDGSTYSSLPGQFSSIEGVVGVGAFDSSTGAKSTFSHYSPLYAEIGAPGAESGTTTGIYSTLPVAMGSYGRLSGTSQSGPQVSAAAAMTIGLIKEYYGTAPSPREVERLLLTSAVKSSQLSGYFKDGNRLDLKALVDKIHADYPNTNKGGGSTDQPSTGCIY